MFKCKKGCSECCGIVPINEKFWHENKHKATKYKKLMIESGRVYPITKDLKCVFLKYNKCQIYDNRPSVCRQFGTNHKGNPLLMCPYLHENSSIRNSKERRYLRKIVDKMFKNTEKRLKSDHNRFKQ